MAELEIGNQVPDFSLPRDGGEMVSLSALRGKPVVLFFYPKDDTTGCTAEAMDFSALQPQFEAAGVVVLGMSPDSVKKHEKFKTKYGLSVPLLSDESKEALQGWGVWVEKSMYGRKYMGVERTTVLIDRKGLIAKIWRKVSVPGHADEVLQAVQAL